MQPPKKQYFITYSIHLSVKSRENTRHAEDPYDAFSEMIFSRFLTLVYKIEKANLVENLFSFNFLCLAISFNKNSRYS